MLVERGGNGMHLLLTRTTTAVLVVCLCGAVSVGRTQGRGSADALEELAGLYSKTRDGEPVWRVSRDGANYLWAVYENGQWAVPIRASVLSDDERAALAQKGVVALAGLHVRKSVLPAHRIDLLRVPEHWKFGDFESRTGFVLLEWSGPMELHKLK